MDGPALESRFHARTRTRTRSVLALGSRLRQCRNVTTLGVKPNFSDYDPGVAEQILMADKIYDPTTLYAELFDTIGKRTFPSRHTYAYVQDKVKQNALFELLRVPRPRTRVFYGKRQQSRIRDHFDYPFIAKIPRGSAMGRGVFLVRSDADLLAYHSLTSTAYIQAYLPAERDIRVVVIGHRVVHAYWRCAAKGEFRTNIAAGGTVGLDPVPEAAVRLALETALACRWDDVGMDILPYKGEFFVLEGNMKYGKEGFRQFGIDYARLMEQMIENGEI